MQSRLPAAIARLTNPFLPGSGRYQVLFSDYDNFAILYSCANLAIAHTDQVWVLGREMEFDVEVRAKIYDILTKLGKFDDCSQMQKTIN